MTLRSIHLIFLVLTLWYRDTIVYNSKSKIINPIVKKNTLRYWHYAAFAYINSPLPPPPFLKMIFSHKIEWLICSHICRQASTAYHQCLCYWRKEHSWSQTDLPGQVVGTFQHDATSQDAENKICEKTSWHQQWLLSYNFKGSQEM